TGSSPTIGAESVARRGWSWTPFPREIMNRFHHGNRYPKEAPSGVSLSPAAHLRAPNGRLAMSIKTASLELELSLSGRFAYLRIGRREWCLAQDAHGWRLDK